MFHSNAGCGVLFAATMGKEHAQAHAQASSSMLGKRVPIVTNGGWSRRTGTGSVPTLTIGTGNTRNAYADTSHQLRT